MARNYCQSDITQNRVTGHLNHPGIIYILKSQFYYSIFFVLFCFFFIKTSCSKARFKFENFERAIFSPLCYWGLTSESHVCWLGALPLEPCLQPKKWHFKSHIKKIFLSHILGHTFFLFLAVLEFELGLAFAKVIPPALKATFCNSRAWWYTTILPTLGRLR
jgi:hypothetical protein